MSHAKQEGSGSRPLVVDQSLHFPLSFAQQRLWILDQLDPGKPTYNLPVILKVSGNLDVAALHQSFTEIARRHETLRTSFHSRRAEVYQLISPQPNLLLPLIDLSCLDEQSRNEEKLRLARQEATTPFDLRVSPLIRVRLVREQPDLHLLLITMHHIISDGWSLGVLVKEMSHLYSRLSKGKSADLDELQIQYADYAVWQREWLSGEELERQMSYWRQRIEAGAEIAEIASDYPRPAVATHRGASERIKLSREMSEGLKAVSRQQGATLFMVMLAGWKVLMYRYSGQTRVRVATAIANRNRAEIEGLIGFFVNTLLIESRIRGEMRVREVIGEVREAALGAYAHQDVPFEKVVEEMEPERDLSRQPLFQVMFVLQNAPSPAVESSGIKVRWMDVDTESAHFDLTVYTMEIEGEMVVTGEYRKEMFEKERMEQMMKHYKKVLEKIVEDVEEKVMDIELVESGAEVKTGAAVHHVDDSFSFNF